MSMPAERLPAARRLGELLPGVAGLPDVAVTGIAADSRRVRPGDLFLACSGERAHGLDFATAAVAAGAAAVAWDADTAARPPARIDVPAVAVPGLGQRLGDIANRFFDYPSRDVGVAGVTGTNGKTTVAWLVAECLEALGQRCGYVGTLGAGIGEIEVGEGMTTPAAVELHALLADFRARGASCAAMEVSSHALAQNRVDGVEFDTVMFTNLSRDHLDYHGDMASYAAAKERLFTDYPARNRIVNLDSEWGNRLAARCGQDVVTVSTNFDRVANGRPFVFVRSIVARDAGSVVRVGTSWGDGRFELPIPGDFNVANAALVMALLLQRGVALDAACDVLGTVAAPPGRLQRVPGADGLPAVYVDYAHTPAALEFVLRALRAHCGGLLWCVFGCGGDRDAGKRPLMGRAAERLADRVVITNDNPRGESPAGIIADIVAGLRDRSAATVIEDRGAAIAWALRSAAAGDVVLIAGKGHENYQLIGGRRLDFSDAGSARANLEALAGSGA